MPDLEWEDAAACRAPWVDTDWFFPSDPEDLEHPSTAHSRTRDNYARAKAVCSRCPVVRECLRQNLYAEVGVFGGYSEGEREAIAAGRAVPVRLPRPTTRGTGRRAVITDQITLGIKAVPVRAERVNVEGLAS